MGASMVVVGLPISPVPGAWITPSQVGNAVAASAGWQYFIPLASLAGGQAEASVLLGQGRATIVG
jgi:hypothetical protein